MSIRDVVFFRPWNDNIGFTKITQISGIFLGKQLGNESIHVCVWPQNVFFGIGKMVEILCLGKKANIAVHLMVIYLAGGSYLYLL